MTVNVPEYGFPTVYDQNYLVLLVRNPNCIFAYWEFSQEQMDLVANEFGCTWGQTELVMRLYDQTGLNFDGQNAHSYSDITIHPLANNHYVKDVQPNHSYCVEIGALVPDGRFVTLLRSNTVQTPRDTLSEDANVIMADLLDRLGLADRDGRSVGDRTGQGENGPETFGSEGVYAGEKRKAEGE